MRDNKGGIVDFPLRYIEDHALEDALEPLRKNCDGIVTDEELYKGAQLAKGSPIFFCTIFGIVKSADDEKS